MHEEKIAYSPLESQQFCEIDKGEIIYNQLFVEAIHYFELLQIAHLQQIFTINSIVISAIKKIN